MNYSIEGLGLKLNTREDIAPYLRQIEPNITQLEEIHLCGNTIGVGAAQALAEVLSKASAIRVRTFQYLLHEVYRFLNAPAGGRFR
jgi:Ran GTPase-activating protein 1